MNTIHRNKTIVGIPTVGLLMLQVSVSSIINVSEGCLKALIGKNTFVNLRLNLRMN